ncbi:putative peptidoglycan lipid II flippase [Caldanaerovirga acetigignens]|uniref:Putative peptidoglycan lipid II flippase n=1 Tax=Caldanaerovirga acetigignens TaxID=447595 RepID=A0A1M7MLA1_9FIRM|nr:hypothetical protein [Caldanaerovirga acetigignens]SHM91244.1 putative peptidoglycan lipid II flippase [Caldanaerovirga acetigignens]
MPTLIGIPYNFIIIAALLLHDMVGPYGLVAATLAGSALQLLLLLIFAFQKGYRYRTVIDLKDGDVIKVASLSVPVMMGRRCSS